MKTEKPGRDVVPSDRTLLQRVHPLSIPLLRWMPMIKGCGTLLKVGGHKSNRLKPFWLKCHFLQWKSMASQTQDRGGGANGNFSELQHIILCYGPPCPAVLAPLPPPQMLAPPAPPLAPRFFKVRGPWPSPGPPRGVALAIDRRVS